MKKSLLVYCLVINIVSLEASLTIGQRIDNVIRDLYEKRQDHERLSQQYINSTIDPHDQYKNDYKTMGYAANASFKQASPVIAINALYGLILTSPMNSWQLGGNPQHAAIATALISQFLTSTFIVTADTKNTLNIPLWKRMTIGSLKTVTLVSTLSYAHFFKDYNINAIYAAVGVATASWILDYPNRILLRPYLNKK